jgi:PAS domain-containing protein
MAIVVADADGAILLWSGDAEELIGYSAVEVLGRPVDVIIPPGYRDRHWRGFHAAMDTGTARSEGTSAKIPVLRATDPSIAFPAGSRCCETRSAGGRSVGVSPI